MSSRVESRTFSKSELPVSEDQPNMQLGNRDIHKMTLCQARCHAVRIGFALTAISIKALALILFGWIMYALTCGKAPPKKELIETFQYTKEILKIATHSFYTACSFEKGIKPPEYNKFFYETYKIDKISGSQPLMDLLNIS